MPIIHLDLRKSDANNGQPRTEMATMVSELNESSKSLGSAGVDKQRFVLHLDYRTRNTYPSSCGRCDQCLRPARDMSHTSKHLAPTGHRGCLASRLPIRRPIAGQSNWSTATKRRVGHGVPSKIRPRQTQACLRPSNRPSCRG